MLQWFEFMEVLLKTGSQKNTYNSGLEGVRSRLHALSLCHLKNHPRKKLMYYLANKYTQSLLFTFLKTKCNVILLLCKITIKKLKSMCNNRGEIQSLNSAFKLAFLPIAQDFSN